MGLGFGLFGGPSGLGEPTVNPPGEPWEDVPDNRHFVPTEKYSWHTRHKPTGSLLEGKFGLGGLGGFGTFKDRVEESKQHVLLFLPAFLFRHGNQLKIIR